MFAKLLVLLVLVILTTMTSAQNFMPLFGSFGGGNVYSGNGASGLYLFLRLSFTFSERHSLVEHGGNRSDVADDLSIYWIHQAAFAMASKMIVIVLLMLLAVLSSAQQFMPVWGAPGFGNFMLAGNQADGMYLLCGSVNCGRG
ncbi:unnamed protein product [Bursaphelenchus xylophilus]|uniref:(pine wood nematode) hypothetical protein n=1 Tax=Bursaphelenchus xylophilus TaxID=6326 RepID=A0A7I8WRZ4_BURXY|nr:unnamed protein product [Bursaphelenchus xylophilus]CAG9115037.1 unnamed protein product [Bursaphelenchus xylophilus]